jgi:hypothetical protein
MLAVSSANSSREFVKRPLRNVDLNLVVAINNHDREPVIQP